MVRNLIAEANTWIRNMESGCYPRGVSTCDSELRAEVVRQLRDRLAKGSEPIRRFLDQHSMAVIVGNPELTREYVALIDATRKGKLRSKLDLWAVALWERFPFPPHTAGQARVSHIKDRATEDLAIGQ